MFLSYPLEGRLLPTNIIMLYTSRNNTEFDVAQLILERSYACAKGQIK